MSRNSIGSNKQKLINSKDFYWAKKELLKFKDFGLEWNPESELAKKISEIIGVRQILTPEKGLDIIGIQEAEAEVEAEIVKEKEEEAEVEAEAKVEYLDNQIDGWSEEINKEFNGNEELKEKIRLEIKNIIDDDDILSNKEKASSLAKVIAKEKLTPEVEVSALKTILAIKSWQKENITEVRKYRAKGLEKKLVEEIKKDNPNITDDKIRTIYRLADNINRVYNSNGGFEIEKDAMLEMEEYKDESIGKKTIAWNDTQGIGGLIKQTPKQFREIIKNNQEIEESLRGVNIPYKKFDKLASYDRVMSSIKNPEMKRFIESARSRFQTLEKLTNRRFSQISNNFVNRIGNDRLRSVANNFFNKSIIKVNNGFATKIGGQSVSNFIQSSMNTMLKNGLGGGIKTASNKIIGDGIKIATKASINAAKKIGVKAVVGGVKLAAGATTGPVGWLVTAGLVVKDFFGNIIQKYNLGITNNKLVDFVIIGTIGGLFFCSTLFSLFTSSLVPTIETEGGGSGGGGSISHGEITYTEDRRVRSCGVGMDVNWDRNNDNNFPHIPESGLGNVDSYNQELKNYIGDNYKKRCGVVYAAEYLANKFKYWVPYYSGGFYDSEGLDPKWGKKVGSDKTEKNRTRWGLDCDGFTHWVYYNGNDSPTDASESINFGDCDRVRSFIQPGDTLQISGDYHVAIILEYTHDYIKFAHAGGTSGVTTGLIDICNGQLQNGNKNMKFDTIFRENISQVE